MSEKALPDINGVMGEASGEVRDASIYLNGAGTILARQLGATGFAFHLVSLHSMDMELAIISGVKPFGSPFITLKRSDFPREGLSPGGGVYCMDGSDARLGRFHPHTQNFPTIAITYLSDRRGPLGLLWLFFDEKRDLDTSDVRLIEEVAALTARHMSLMLDTWWKEKSREKVLEETIGAISSMANSPEVQEILKIFAEAAMDLTGADRCLVLTGEKKQGPMKIAFSRGMRELKDKPFESVREILESAGLMDRRETILPGNVLRSLGLGRKGVKWHGFFFRNPDSAVLIGGSEFPAAGGAVEEAVGDMLTAAANSIELIGSKEGLRENMEGIRVISQMVQEMIDMPDLKGLLNKIFEALNRVIYFPRGALYLFDRSSNRLKMENHKNIPEDMIKVKEETALERHHGIVKETLAPIICGDTRKDLRMNYVEGMGYPISVLCVPLIFRGRYIGDITLSSLKENFFDSRDLRMATTFANFAAIAIENHMLKEEALERESRLTASEKISSLISSELNLKKIINFCLEQTRKIYPIRSAAMLEEREQDFRAGEFIEDFPFFSKMSVFPREEITKLFTIPRGPKLLLGNAIYQSPFKKMASQNIKALLLLPVVDGDEPYGILAFASDDEDLFSENIISWWAYLSSQLAIAVKKSKLIESLRKNVKELKSTRDQFVQTEKLRALGQLSSGVAHDFNNVLASIMGRAELISEKLKKGSLSREEIRKYMDLIVKSSKDGSETVKRLQEYTKKETAEELIAVDLGRVASDVREMTMPMWKDESEKAGRQIEFILEKDDIPPAAANPSELREAVVNLVLNSIDAMPYGGSIQVKTGREEGKVFISVIDSGTGIPDDLADRIYEPFYTTKEAGTGLGLPVAQNIIKRMGGSLVLERGKGRGTTFTIFLEPYEGPNQGEEKSGEDKSMEGRVLHILVVDDEPDVLEVVGDLLEMLGHSVTSTSSPRKAISLAGEERFDVIISDIGMPKISGWDLLKEVRQMGLDVPVIFISGWADTIEESKVISEGGSGIIPKPFNISDLDTAISRAAGPREGQS